MMDIVEIAIIGFLSLTVFVFASLLVSLKAKNTKALASIVQLTIDKAALLEEVDRLSFISNNHSELNDGFIKFLSESRDQSYKYIEDVQASILELYRSMESGDDQAITDAYVKLIKFLPSNTDDVVD